MRRYAVDELPSPFWIQSERNPRHGASRGRQLNFAIPVGVSFFFRSSLVRESLEMASIPQVLLLFSLILCLAESKDMLRKSIVFDKKTPDVFYCPQKKPKGIDKMLVRAKPLGKLCEFDGKPLPPDYKSDCYNDVDETEYACKEKHRIMKRMKKLEHEIEKKETERASRSRRI